MKKPIKQGVIIGCVCAVLALIGVLLYVQFYPKESPQAAQPAATITPKDETVPSVKEMEYTGEVTTVNDAFSVKVPNGWTASISPTANFSAIMFARPNQLVTLTYNPSVVPTINRSGIPAWSGLTEHFFVLAPTTTNTFTPDDHLEKSSEPFSFDDGTQGTKYIVIKHAEEAKKWGGLLKDSEWQGRTYVYEREGKRIEAHLAVYPSSTIDFAFYEKVVRTIQNIH
jgi:hypothetical protein